MHTMNHLRSYFARPAVLRRSIVLAAIGACAALAILITYSGTGHRTADAAEAPTVQIENFQFSPNTLTVPVGGSVTWINHDGDIHSIAADDGDPQTFKSSGLDTDDKFSFTFTKPGTYTYHCGLHPHMTAKIIVQ
jgi:plastocyanin